MARVRTWTRFWPRLGSMFSSPYFRRAASQLPVELVVYVHVCGQLPRPRVLVGASAWSRIDRRRKCTSGLLPVCRRWAPFDVDVPYKGLLCRLLVGGCGRRSAFAPLPTSASLFPSALCQNRGPKRARRQWACRLYAAITAAVIMWRWSRRISSPLAARTSATMVRPRAGGGDLCQLHPGGLLGGGTTCGSRYLRVEDRPPDVETSTCLVPEATRRSVEQPPAIGRAVFTSLPSSCSRTSSVRPTPSAIARGSPRVDHDPRSIRASGGYAG